VAVRVSIPDPASTETPAAGVGVVALPYDRDCVLESLEALGFVRTSEQPDFEGMLYYLYVR